MLTHRRQRDVPAGMSAVTPADTSADMPADIARAIGALDAAIAGFRERAEADTAMIAGPGLAAFTGPRDLGRPPATGA
jgi:hypothetical protein